MLVLSRKPGEKILIGENISVTVVRIGPNTVRLGIEAPRNMDVMRDELITIDIDETPAACPAGTIQSNVARGARPVN